MADDDLTRRLREAFLGELDESVAQLDRALRGLEAPTDDDRHAWFEHGLRAAHRLKGAARSIGGAGIERACHLCEELLGRIQHAARGPSPAELAVLDAFVE